MVKKGRTGFGFNFLGLSRPNGGMESKGNKGSENDHRRKEGVGSGGVFGAAPGVFPEGFRLRVGCEGTGGCLYA